MLVDRAKVDMDPAWISPLARMLSVYRTGVDIHSVAV